MKATRGAKQGADRDLIQPSDADEKFAWSQPNEARETGPLIRGSLAIEVRLAFFSRHCDLPLPRPNWRFRGRGDFFWPSWLRSQRLAERRHSVGNDA